MSAASRASSSSVIHPAAFTPSAQRSDSCFSVSSSQFRDNLFFDAPPTIEGQTEPRPQILVETLRPVNNEAKEDANNNDSGKKVKKKRRRKKKKSTVYTIDIIEEEDVVDGGDAVDVGNKVNEEKDKQGGFFCTCRDRIRSLFKC